MSKSEETPREAADRVRQELRERIARHVAGGAPKRLSPIRRLHAAAYIGQLVTQLRDDGLSMTEICENLGTKMPGKQSSRSIEPFRLHRWLLKKGADDVTDEVIAHYRGKPEPLRTTATYLHLAGYLSTMCGLDPTDCQGELLEKLELKNGYVWEDESNSQPEQKLAALIQNHAAVVARMLDLGAMLQRAERVQGGVNLKVGPDVAVDLTKDFNAEFSASGHMSHSLWLEVEFPALPTVMIARIPFGIVEGAFKLTSQTLDKKKSVAGSAVAYWDLHLAIGPSGPLNVGAYFVRSTSVELTLGDDVFALPDLQDDVYQFVSGFPCEPVVSLDDIAWTVAFEGEPFYRPQRHISCEESPPSGSVPNAHVTPVTAASIRAWLMTPLSLDLPSGREAGSIPMIDVLERHPSPAPGWIRAHCLARSLETALRDTTLESKFADWMTRYLPALQSMENDWLHETQNKDNALLARWHDTDLKGYDV